MNSPDLSVAVRAFLKTGPKTTTCVTIVAAIAAFPVAAWSADRPAATSDRQATTLPRIRVEGDVVEPDDYSAQHTSSATRTDTPLRDVPQSVTVVTREVIEDQAIQSMADAVRYVPGVTMGQGEGNRDQPTIRGNGTTADFFVDGLRDDTQHFRDVYNVDRLEVLKGPNAMIFGRGGGGGVINRVTKQAGWDSVHAFSLQGGSFNNARATVDVGQGLNDVLAVRLNGLYEDSESYRDDVELKRYGLNPTAALALGDSTAIHLGYEYFSDERTADRGVPSFGGRPLRTDESTFFGDPGLSYADAEVNVLSALIEHETNGGLTIRNRTRYADYDKFYQNVFPAAVSAAGDAVSISAYNSTNDRKNLLNQTDLIWRLELGGMQHTLLSGVEFGQQRSDNFRSTGFFNNAASSFTTPLSSPVISVPITFRQSASDADNRVDADIAAIYVQDQIELSPQWQAVLGLRYDAFDLEFRNHRNGEVLSRDDDFVSPRAGLIFKPIEPVSVYASYSVSYLPSSGDQFSSLSATTRTLEPEEFTNYELGAKWDVRDTLALAAAVFELERTNTTAPGNVAGTVVQTGEQRTRGLELEASGAVTQAWRIMGGYAYQDAEITEQTTAAAKGATVPITPRHTFSLWNRYDFTPAWGLGLGVIHQDEMYAGIDNTVTLPSFTRVDAAAYFAINEQLRVQLNVENLLDREYFLTAHNNNNITPGSPLAFRIGLNGSF
ncbi:MAG: TonB-dependent receptor [Steroidobacter sp.]